MTFFSPLSLDYEEYFHFFLLAEFYSVVYTVIKASLLPVFCLKKNLKNQ